MVSYYTYMKKYDIVYTIQRTRAEATIYLCLSDEPAKKKIKASFLY